VTSANPADRAASRFRLPVQAPLRNLIIASLSAMVGSFEIIAWAAFRLPDFVLAAGILLIAAGAAVAVASLVRHYRLRWVAYVGPDALTVVHGSRRRVLPWDGVASVRLVQSRLEVLAREGRRRYTLPVDRTRAAHDAVADVLQAIDAQLAARS
jgi:Bacterial PH domain